MAPKAEPVKASAALDGPDAGQREDRGQGVLASLPAVSLAIIVVLIGYILATH